MAENAAWTPPINPGDVPDGHTAQWDGAKWNIYPHLPPDFIQPTLDEAIAKEIIQCRSTRQMLLASCDWVFNEDSQIDPNTFPEWKAYRQALRDLPDTDPNWPSNNVIWPNKPQYKKTK